MPINVNKKYENPRIANSYFLGTAIGLWITLKHYVLNTLRLRKKVTIEYPEERRAYSKRFKGLHVLTKREDGTIRCTSCMLCATACPAECIRIVASEDSDPKLEKRPIVYEIDLLRCIFCGYCEEACPVDAIRMGTEYNLANVSDTNFVVGIDFLMDRPSLKHGVYSVYKDPPKHLNSDSTSTERPAHS